MSGNPTAIGSQLRNASANHAQARFVKVDPSDARAVARAHATIRLIHRVHENSRDRSLKHLRSNVRFKELEIVFAYAWRGPELPDDDAGRHDLWIAACHIWHLSRKCGPIVALREWVATWAPWCGPELQEIIDKVDANPKKWSADELAHELGVAVLPFTVRQALGLTTIGSIDVDKAGRLRRRGEESKDRSTERRRENGQVSRSEYLATHSTNRVEPWVPLGISKATYYRRRLHETGANAPKDRDVLVCSHLSHEDHGSVDRRAPEAPRRQPDDVIDVHRAGYAMVSPPLTTHLGRAIARAYRLESLRRTS